MLPLCLLALLLQTAQPAGPATDGNAAAQPRVPDQNLAVGELRVEPVVIAERRLAFMETVSQNPPESDLNLRVRLVGEEILNIVHMGSMIIEKAVDEEGNDLRRTTEYTEEEKNYTRRVALPEMSRRRTGLYSGVTLNVPSRGSKTIKEVKGAVRVISASKTEEIIITNPQQYAGKMIDHPRLKELGVEIVVKEPGAVRGAEDPRSFLTLAYKANGEHIAGAEFCDAWLRPIFARSPDSRKASDGDRCYVFQTNSVPFDEGTQMILEVFVDVTEKQVKFDLTDIPLP